MMKGKLNTIAIYIDAHVCVSREGTPLFSHIGVCRLNLRSGVYFSIGESAPNQKGRRTA